MDGMKHNFVVFGTSDDFYTAAYCDIMGKENVRYISEPLQRGSRLINILYRIYEKAGIKGQCADAIFRRIFNSRYFANDFKTRRPICFIFFGYARGKILERGYYGYIKKRYPDAKLVCFFQDLVSSNKGLDIERFRRFFDLILTFDHEDARKYGFVYHPLVYSQKCPFDVPDIYSCSDVFFAGKAKNRLPEIETAFEKLSAAGLNCDFHVVGVKRSERAFSEGINYCKFMTYTEYLGRLQAARCILEIMQHGGHGFTLRVNEAIAYNKKLISNNRELLSAPFYKPEYISVFDDPQNIDVSFIQKNTGSVNYGDYKEQISPIALLHFIENRLENKDG